MNKEKSEWFVILDTLKELQKAAKEYPDKEKFVWMLKNAKLEYLWADVILNCSGGERTQGTNDLRDHMDVQYWAYKNNVNWNPPKIEENEDNDGTCTNCSADVNEDDDICPLCLYIKSILPKKLWKKYESNWQERY
jgi:hypothetical protein